MTKYIVTVNNKPAISTTDKEEFQSLFEGIAKVGIGYSTFKINRLDNEKEVILNITVEDDRTNEVISKIILENGLITANKARAALNKAVEETQTVSNVRKGLVVGGVVLGLATAAYVIFGRK